MLLVGWTDFGTPVCKFKHTDAHAGLWYFVNGKKHNTDAQSLQAKDSTKNIEDQYLEIYVLVSTVLNKY